MPTEEKTRAVANWPTPSSMKEVRSFLGLVNFYQRFVPAFSNVVAPLADFISSKATFTWEDKHHRSFDLLKQSLISPPVLDYPRHSDKFILSTNVSNADLGTIMSTSRGTVIEHASRTLSATEKIYATVEKHAY